MKKAAIVDLDGTFVKVNTFKCFIKFSFKLFIKRLNLIRASLILILVIGRKCRLYSHSTLKYYTLKAIGTLDKKIISTFIIKNIIPNINQNVVNKILHYKSVGYSICLSTAAPDIYVKGMRDEINYFDFYISTPCVIGLTRLKWKENIQVEKLLNTQTEMTFKGDYTINIVLTDHHDDIPLLKVASEYSYLVNPSKQTLNLVSKEGITYKIIS